MEARIQQQERENRIHLADYKGKRLFFCGIGGSSMSGLAQICRAQGYEVTGSDRSASPFSDELVREGIPVILGQKAENVHGCDLFIYSAAIKPDNPERAEAAKLGIPEMERSVLLGQISSHYPEVIAISGGHGKTTTTSMLALILIEAGLDPTVHVGGMVPFLGSGVRVGGHDIFLTEACEYVESFMTLHPTQIAITNIDDDHLDYFKDIEQIEQTFVNFVDLLPEDGWLCGNNDDPRVTRILQNCGHTAEGFGREKGDLRAEKIIQLENGGQRFTVTKQGKELGEITLRIAGLHNVYDALCAVSVALHMEVSMDTIAAALIKYTLTGRRFEKMGERNGATIYHDYAHHPTEIAACLEGARSVCKGKLYVVFQCNSYTRAKTLFSDNVTCFHDADLVLVPDIYPGREVDTGLVHAKDMVNAINQGGSKAEYIPTFEEISDYLAPLLQPGDIVVTLGSGDVYFQTQKLL